MRHVTAVVLGALLLCFLVEATTRVALFGVRGLDLRRVPVTRGVVAQGIMKGSEHPGVGFVYRPNLDVFSKLARIRTNSQGLRDREYSLERPEPVFRVAVLGSSFTVATGVSIESTYHSLLEERLSARYAPVSYEFINFAVGLASPANQVAHLLHRALPYEPDLVLVGVTEAATPLYLEEWTDPKLGGNKQPNWMPHVIRINRRDEGPRSYFLRMVRGELNRPITYLPQPPRPTLYPGRDVVSRLAEVGRSAELPIVLVRLHYSPSPQHEVDFALAERAEAEGLYHLDTREAFAGTNPRDFWVSRLDRHPNERAHAIFADVIEEFLLRRGLLGVAE